MNAEDTNPSISGDFSMKVSIRQERGYVVLSRARVYQVAIVDERCK